MRGALLGCLSLGLNLVGFGLNLVGCSKDDGHSTLHNAAHDVETEVGHAPQALKRGADDVDESARGLVGADDHKDANAPAPAEQPQK